MSRSGLPATKLRRCCGVCRWAFATFGLLVPLCGGRPVMADQAVQVAPLPFAAPSDPRAVFVPGNVSTCAAAGFTGAIQLGSPSNTSASDSNVAGSVTANSGPIQPGRGQELNVSILDSSAVIEAVVVKGSNGFNVYSNSAVLPPALPPPQHYISPLNDGTNVPNISHWFVCYRFDAPTPRGSLTIQKVVVTPIGVPVAPLPDTYSVLATCEGQQPLVVSFGSGGGRSINQEIVTGIPVGTTCVVAEATGAFPAGSLVTYDPPGADTTGVVVPDDDIGVTVSVINDFSNVQVQRAELQLVKLVLADPGDVQPPASYAAHVVCDDGTDAIVTLPGQGGAGTPTLSVTVGALCAVEEDTSSLAPGWTVTYIVGDGLPSADAVFPVLGPAPVTVTISNDPPAATPTTSSVVAATTTIPSASTVAGVTGTTGSGDAGGPGSLPATGGSQFVGALMATAGLLTGIALLRIGRRERREIEN